MVPLKMYVFFKKGVNTRGYLILVDHQNKSLLETPQLPGDDPQLAEWFVNGELRSVEVTFEWSFRWQKFPWCFVVWLFHMSSWKQKAFTFGNQRNEETFTLR